MEFKRVLSAEDIAQRAVETGLAVQTGDGTYIMPFNEIAAYNMAANLITKEGSTTTLEVKNALQERGMYCTQAQASLALRSFAKRGMLSFAVLREGYRLYAGTSLATFSLDEEEEEVAQDLSSDADLIEADIPEAVSIDEECHCIVCVAMRAIDR